MVWMWNDQQTRDQQSAHLHDIAALMMAISTGSTSSCTARRRAPCIGSRNFSDNQLLPPQSGAGHFSLRVHQTR